jgi:hypothetical protein
MVHPDWSRFPLCKQYGPNELAPMGQKSQFSYMGEMASIPELPEWSAMNDRRRVLVVSATEALNGLVRVLLPDALFELVDGGLTDDPLAASRCR